MNEDAPMDLVDDRFADQSIQDEPVDDGESFYNEDVYVDCEEHEDDDVVPTSENFRLENRYKPSLHTPRELPTIREENREDVRSNTSSRVNTRPPSVLSDKSNDISNMFGFQDGGRAIDQYTDQFYSEGNRAERLFPEAGFLQNSPVRDKQNSWEPSVCHYEKQPTPEVKNNSPGLVFANMSSKKDVTRKQENVRPGKMMPEKVNDENEPKSRRFSPERNTFTTSPMNSTKYLEEKTSTPKRPGGTNRLGTRGLPSFECSTIYDISPQRTSGTPKTYESRHPTNAYTPNSATTSDTVLSNRTIGDNTVQNVLKGVDINLLTALENARKKRDRPQVKPDFRLNSLPRGKLSSTQRPKSDDHSSMTSIVSSSTQNNTGYRKIQEQRNSATSTDLTNSNTSNFTNNTSRVSTAKNDFSRSSRQRNGFSDSSVSTIIPNMNSMTTRDRDGRDSVSSVRTISRASSTMTVGGGNGHMTSGAPKPLRFHVSRLGFGYVPIGETLTMQLEVENTTDRPCKVNARLDSKITCFKVLDNATTMIDPKKAIKVRVAFTPTSLGRYSLYLKAEVAEQNFTQKIPVWGWGGVSKIAPISARNLQPTSNSSEFAMFVSDMKRIAFKLGNSGDRSGFALLTVYDSAMRQVPNSYVRFNPSNGIVIGKNYEKLIEIRIDPSYHDHYGELTNNRTSSAMSTVSTASSMASLRRRVIAGSDFFVQVAWGVEGIRERLRMLEMKHKRRQMIDGLDFTSHPFTDEKCVVYPPPDAYPTISDEDHDLFAASYSNFYINIFSSPDGLNAFRAATVSADKFDNDATVLETSAFRHQTFVNDVTMVPRHTKLM
ncbi:hypothetical protein L5515_001627 [Caenorhabditis briggsae]|uniref:Cep192/Spd-2-like domain-containing protein n=1 Tax=Caenorhabditis briggsae TaxID=6238 RepID=A0AAE9E5U4_CAEBR|nr:hypothetical protein L5515_001627 [Caenorhabditis briggsae]